MKDEKDDKVACTMNGDRVRLGPDLGNGMHPFVRHKADHTMVTGICSRVKEGENIAGTGAMFIKGDPARGDYAVEYELGAAGGGASKGPAKVNSEAFAEGWDRIFGSKPTTGES